MKHLNLILLTLGLLTSACTDEKIVEVRVKDTVTQSRPSSWGIEFSSKHINDEEPRVQELAKAVALVEFAEGGTATGFFISPDGLFLTNEHVISRSRCDSGRCAGVRIIQDFNINGTPKIYQNFNVLAQNKELDYALIYVRPPFGEQVPYISLQEQDVPNGDAPLETMLKIIGHPFSSSLRTSLAKIESSQGSRLKLRSTAISGNSGSPLIDPATGKLIGLYNAGFWHKDTVDVAGNGIKHFGYATSIQAILKNLNMLYPGYFDGSRYPTGFSLNLYRISSRESLANFPDIAPETRIPEADVKTIEAAIGQGLGRTAFEKLFNRVVFLSHLSYRLSSTKNTDDLNLLSRAINSLHLNGIRIPRINHNSFISTLLGFVRRGAIHPYMGVLVATGKVEKQACLESVGRQELSELQKIFLMTNSCFSDVDEFEIPLLDKLEFVATREETLNNEHLRNLAFLSVKHIILSKRRLEGNYHDKLRKVLTQLLAKSESLALSYRLENLLILLKNPQLRPTPRSWNQRNF